MKVRAAKICGYALAMSSAAAIMLWTASAVAQSGSGADLTGSAWLAEEVGGRGAAEGVRSTMEFTKADQVNGMAGCNRYFGPVSIDGDAIAFGDLAATLMMCPPELMDQEQRFMQALREAKRFELERNGEKLLVYGDGTEPLIQLSRIIDK